MLLEPFVGGLGPTPTSTGSCGCSGSSLDRMFPDAFVHADLGPDDGRVGRSVLRVDRELRQVVPNLTLQVDPPGRRTPCCARPSETVFAVGQAALRQRPDDGRRPGRRLRRGLSCYNTLPSGGGAYTLVRLNLGEVGRRCTAASRAAYLDRAAPALRRAHRGADGGPGPVPGRGGRVLRALVAGERRPGAAGPLHCDVRCLRSGRGGRPSARARGRDGALRPRRERERRSPSRSCPGSHDLVAARPMPYCEATEAGRCCTRSPVSTPTAASRPAARVPAGDEPGLLEHLRTVSPQPPALPRRDQRRARFRETARRNPDAVVDVIRGAFSDRDARLHLQPRQQRLHPDHRLPGAQVGPRGLDGGARHASTFLGAGSLGSRTWTAGSRSA